MNFDPDRVAFPPSNPTAETEKKRKKNKNKIPFAECVFPAFPTTPVWFNLKLSRIDTHPSPCLRNYPLPQQQANQRGGISHLAATHLYFHSITPLDTHSRCWIKCQIQRAFNWKTEEREKREVLHFPQHIFTFIIYWHPYITDTTRQYFTVILMLLLKL